GGMLCRNGNARFERGFCLDCEDRPPPFGRDMVHALNKSSAARPAPISREAIRAPAPGTVMLNCCWAQETAQERDWVYESQAGLGRWASYGCWALPATALTSRH
ncbi:hypothetical protein NDU88_000914, partial [Pleurodeles waltl]